MTRLVIDTNVFVSLLIRPGEALSGLAGYIDRSATILYSSDTLTELADVLRRGKFTKYTTIADVARLMEWIIGAGDMVTIEQRLTGSRDVDDNKFLSLAVAGQADYLISGDKDLLVLGRIQNIPILTPADFMNGVSH